MTTKAKSLNMETEHLFFFFSFSILCFSSSDSRLLKINFPTIIISNDNNLYSINYLYCTIISPRIDLQQRGSLFVFFQSKAIHSQFLLFPQFNKASAEHTQRLTDSEPGFFFLLSCTEIKQDILPGKKMKQKANPNRKQS